ncbi:TIGR01777 family oxidoreductase [Aquimarina muelleri]|uniref:NAD-dependent epimerase n=1 Tax=Aquimarina muelleri TaxID=279356 RepID=A0A918JWE4_9FLAO|nr:TIGR01777 family oxidoreductase [Aquimarina muelleri]MCX2764551.1 TIGR01777 family oxidoreductase [Aquimarina muelleri]GGX23013.1 NAD-dependent epimerase [Aquimarina muelleri]
MKVLITGATGLIGKEIVKLCHQSNIDVNYLTTSTSKIDSKPNYRGYFWDPKKRELDAECFDEVEVIINLVGATVAKRWTSSYKKEILESRTGTASLILESLKNTKHSIRHIVSASAVGVYPNSFQNYYTEDVSEQDSGFLAEVVTQWENAVLQFETLGIGVSLLRIGLVLSARGGAFPKITKPIQIKLGACFGSGKQWQSWIHIHDLARMFLFVIEEELTGVFNAVAPNPVSNEKLTYIIAEKLNEKIILPNIPKFLMKLILGEMHNILFSSQRVCNDKISTAGFIFDYDNIRSAVDVLIEDFKK